MYTSHLLFSHTCSHLQASITALEDKLKAQSAERDAQEARVRALEQSLADTEAKLKVGGGEWGEGGGACESAGGDAGRHRGQAQGVREGRGGMVANRYRRKAQVG